MGESDNNKIDANPTKEFFIEMLTRDIALDRAILDLIDNSVDSFRYSGKKSSWIKIELCENKFVIYDNCGGIDKYTAQNYAFRFGRPSSRKPTLNSVGQFGVGMKRTLFKLGTQFLIESRKDNDCFRVNINIDEWKIKDEKDWTFEIEDVNESKIDNGETKITVTSLHHEVSGYFEQRIFVESLIKEISKAHFKSIINGLDIYVGDQKVPQYDISFISSDKITPFYEILVKENVTIKIIAGVTKRDLKQGGWYIVCNGRLVESAQQSSITGWGIDKLPIYHADFAYFRGVVEFECEDSSRLPWTTTKTGVDVSNPVYINTLVNMKNAMRQILPFLRNKSKEENWRKEALLEDTPINDSIDNALRENKFISVDKIKLESEFKAPLLAQRLLEPNEVSIQYKVSIDEIKIAKELLGANSNTDVGRKTFNYFMEYEYKNG